MSSSANSVSTASQHSYEREERIPVSVQTRRRVVMSSASSSSSTSASVPVEENLDMADGVRRATPAQPIPEVATEDIVSRLEPSDLEKIRDLYHIPQNVVLVVPGLNWRASCPPVGWVCLYEGHLRAGLRFPLVPFVRNILNEYRVPLAQIVPNGIRILMKFLLLCGENEVEPTIELFRFCFQLRKAAQASGYKLFMPGLT